MPLPSDQSIYAQLARAQTALDRLLGQVGRGMRGAADYDQAEAEADAIARQPRAAFRTRGARRR